MQTFLPLPDFAESARVLDNKRLGKQRVETLQICSALWCRKLVNTKKSVGTGRFKSELVDHYSYGTWTGDEIVKTEIMKTIDLPREEWRVENSSVGWANHPATKMWQGEGFALLEYQTAICNEWTSRGFKDTCLEKTEVLYLDAVDSTYMGMGWPAWMGDEAFHASHRSNLLRKDPEWYGQWGWTDPDDLDYVWPR